MRMLIAPGQFLRSNREKWARSRRGTAVSAYWRRRRLRILIGFVIVAHLVGAMTAVQALMETRTPQGTIAWVVSLTTFPYLSLPTYWIFGRTRFNGYVKKRQESVEDTDPAIRRLVRELHDQGFVVSVPNPWDKTVRRLAKLPTVEGNDVELLRNGEAIFSSIFEGIEQAREYLLIQFYIVRDDGLGRKLQRMLAAAVERGVRVYFLYDEFGSYRLSRAYLRDLRRAGIHVRAFNSTRGEANRFQLNFRNHRKIVVADGRWAWVGGANVGDEYMGLHRNLTPWVDAMAKVEGPAVQLIQVPFLEDWYWASGEFPTLDWKPRAARSGVSRTVLVLPSGPADQFETCALYFLDAIHSARRRIWIASPYFVPDEQIVSALKLAALRGVDVRILTPLDCDNFLVNLSGWSYVAPLEEAGVKVYRHENGFLHYKAMLRDDDVAAVGTANFDNRSFRLNFEITLEVRDPEFAREVETMFLEDFADSRLSSALEIEERGFFFQLAIRAARLMAPIQ